MSIRDDSKKIKKRPSLFSSKTSFDKSIPDRRNVTLSLKELSKTTNIASTASFKYDSPGAGIKNTQQCNVDWSKWENHCFFDSAQSKVNIAFDTIVNGFPFDGTKKEIESFFDNLTGYEKYIFDKFPKYNGFLTLSGATGPTNKNEGQYIEVFDSRGYQFPNFSSKVDGKSVIEFGKNPFTFEFYVHVPDQSNDNQIILQKRYGENHAVSLALSSSVGSSCNLIFSVVSGTNSIFASGSLEKGKFTHISSIYDRDVENKALLYFNNKLVGSSSNSTLFDTIDLFRSSLFIGSGSSFYVDSKIMPGGQISFVPKQTLSGSIDEIRIFHQARNQSDLQNYKDKTIYAEDGLKLYLKFNEATGSYSPNSVVLDSSGNSLHSKISNYSISTRITGSISNPMINENLSISPILFPGHYLVKELNEDLLESGKRYDFVNPNTITKLFPPHLFLEGQEKEGFQSLQGNLYSPLSGKSLPGSGKLGSAQILTGFLLIYAKFFDEIKIVLDSVSKFLHVDYDEFGNIPDQLIPILGRYYGIELPSLFSNSTILEFIDGEDLGESRGTSPRSLRDLQNELWKRFLINLPYIIKSKGTKESIKSSIRSFGINPDNLMNIREFGGPTRSSISNSRITSIRNLPLLDFSGSKKSLPGTEKATGFFSGIPHVIFPYLTGSRLEPGYPNPQGPFVGKSENLRNGISSEPEDGLLTSGSFSFEGFYRFLEPNRTGFLHPVSQSLARFSITGSSITKGTPVINLVAVSGSEDRDPSLNLFIRSSMQASKPGIKLVLTGANIFNGDPWYVGFGRVRSDDIITSVSQSYLATPTSYVGSSSYFLTCIKSVNGKVNESYYTSKYLKDKGELSSFENKSGLYNSSGTFVTIGSQSLGSHTNLFLTDPGLDSVSGFSAGDLILASTTDFTGQIGKIRFWSRALRDDQITEHSINPSSFGTKDPNINYNFVSMNTGSFERVRLDFQLGQAITSSDPSGQISLINFTQEIGNAAGVSFEPSVKVIKSEQFYQSSFSPKFDLSQTDNKVRVRSVKSFKKLSENLYSLPAPQYEIRKSEEPDDDNRFSVEFSSVKALEDDIMSMFSTLVFFDNALGRPDLIFDEIYPDLEQASKVYFRRLFAKPEFQNYFYMFKWFNQSFGYIIEQLVPRNTKFLGVDFVYESHPLERNRFRYLFDEVYLLSSERSFDRGDILLSQYVGKVKKF